MMFRRLMVLLAALACPLAFALENDDDGDGFQNDFEVFLGTDPANAASTPASIAKTPLDVVSLSATLDFSQPTSDVVAAQVKLNLPPGFDPNGKQIGFYVGGGTAVLTFDASGVAIGEDVQANLTVSTGALTVIGVDDIQSFLADEGLVANPASDSIPVTILTQIFFNGAYMEKNVSGTYFKVPSATNQTRAFASSGPPSSNFKGVITDLTATPNPLDANVVTKFTAALSGFAKEASVTLDFGDGTPSVNGPLSSFATSLKAGVEHTYTANGIYTAKLSVFQGGTTASSGIVSGSGEASLVVVVGDGAAVNAASRMASNATVDDDGNATLNINVSNVPGAVSASTVFDEDLTRAGTDPETGLLVGRGFPTPGLFRATSTALDSLSAPLSARVRKTIGVRRKVGTSGALPPPADTSVKLSKMSGKFAFNAETPDQVSFSGAAQLPAGFNPALEGGNTFLVGLGNVLDAFTVDAKGKVLLPTDKKRVTKAKVKYPKLSGAVAGGGEIVKFDLTLSIPNLDVAGFDTEGITNALRTDEKGRKSVSRFIQMNLSMAGVTYESLLPVKYSLSKDSANGVMTGRGGK